MAPDSIINKQEPVLALAPMAEITHSAFRRLVEGFGGCDLYFTEMLSAAALMNASPYESSYLDFSPVPEKTIVQLAGCDPDRFFSAAEKLISLPFAGFDINMGCSVGAIRKKGWGIELMNQPIKVREIIRGLRRRVGNRSLSVKLRLGEKEDGDYLLDFCRMLEDEGVDFISLNPRIRKDGRNRPARWQWVSFLKEALSIPILGNGDIYDWATYNHRKNISKADGFLIGRGAVTQPWLFSFLKGREISSDFSMKIDQVKTCKGYFSDLKLYQPEDFWVSRARRFFYYYTDNFKFGHTLKYSIQNSSSLSVIEDSVFSYFKRNPEEVIIGMGVPGPILENVP